MKILLVGRNGQVGSCLEPLLFPLGELVSLGREHCDLRDAAAVAAAVREAKPDVIVNTAAYTAVDKAESEPELAHAINARAPEAMARSAAAIGAHLVHFSTDYVYDGSKDGAYVESDATAPLGVYGASKLAGEDAIRESGANATILRTAWVFGPIGANFVKTMLRLAKERDSLRVVHDQVGNPTSAELLASLTATAIARRGKDLPGGTFHAAGGESCSWNDFTRVIVEEARAYPALSVTLDPTKVERIGTADYPTKATRPANSRLDCAKLERELGVVMPSYRPYLKHMLRLMVG